MTLKDCSRAELMLVIDALKGYLFPTGDYCIRQALLLVENQRLETRHAKADELSKLSYQKRQEYLDLLSPYAGKRLADIPLSVLDQADAAVKEAQAADRKWNKLMGLSERK